MRWGLGMIAKLVVSTSLAGAGGAALAQGANDEKLSLEQAATIFGIRENIQQASLSPDGTLLATIEPAGTRGTVVRVLDLTVPDSKPVAIAAAKGDPERLQWCKW